MLGSVLTESFTIPSPSFGAALSQGYVHHVVNQLTPLLPPKAQLLRWAVVAQTQQVWTVEATYAEAKAG